MRLDESEQSGDIEDRRGESGGGGFGGGGFGMPMGGGLSLGTIAVLLVLGWALGIDPRVLISGGEIVSGGGGEYRQPAPPVTQARRTGAPSDDMGKFVATVLGNIEVEWRAIFQQRNEPFRKPILVLYQDATNAACGGAQSAMGPFYCPTDEKIYLDTGFFREIESRFRGCDAGSRSCQFSQAYVIAHEFGHHVQNLLKILPKVQQGQRGLDRAAANRLQVQVELQADCFAGLWASHENKRLLNAGKPSLVEPGDIEAALRTASAIGDDTLQRKATGRVVPDSFTHGSSEQRQRWFQNGYRDGTVAACDTFRTANL